MVLFFSCFSFSLTVVLEVVQAGDEDPLDVPLEVAALQVRRRLLLSSLFVLVSFSLQVIVGVSPERPPDQVRHHHGHLVVAHASGDGHEAAEVGHVAVAVGGAGRDLVGHPRKVSRRVFRAASGQDETDN